TRGEQPERFAGRQGDLNAAGEPSLRVGHGSSFNLCASAAVRVRPYTDLSWSILARTGGPKGVLPSKACRTMPSTRSPRDRSRYSARPLSTFSVLRSMRRPVCARSIVTTVTWYHVKRPGAPWRSRHTGVTCTTMPMRCCRQDPGEPMTFEYLTDPARGPQGQ